MKVGDYLYCHKKSLNYTNNFFYRIVYINDEYVWISGDICVIYHSIENDFWGNSWRDHFMTKSECRALKIRNLEENQKIEHENWR